MEFLAKAKRLKFRNNSGETIEKIGLFPLDISQQEKLKKVKDDEKVIVSFNRFRRKNLLDQLHAITYFLWQNWRDAGHYPNVNIFRAYLNLEVGFCEPLYYQGKVSLIPKSWSFKTDHDVFMDECYNPIIELGCDYMKMTRDQLIQTSIENSLDNH